MQTSKHKKGSEDYLIEMTDFVISDIVKEKTHLFKAYNYYNGVRDKYQYENLEKNFNVGNPTSVSFTPLIRKHIDAIIGEFLATPIRPKLSCKDENTLTNILRDKQLEISKQCTELLSKYLQNTIYDALAGKKQQDQQVIDPIIDQEIKEIKKSVDRNFISNYEIAGQKIIQYIMQSRNLDFKNKLQTMLLDLLVSGEVYFKVKPTSNKSNFQIEIEDVLNTFVDKDPKSKYVKNGYKSVIRKWMTKEEIIIKYGSELSQSDIDDLNDMKIYNSDTRNFVLVTSTGARCGNYNNAGLLDGVGVHPFEESTLEYNRKWELIPVYEVEWIDYIKKDKNIQSIRYTTTRIGTDIYILNGEDEYRIINPDNPNSIELSLNGLFYTDGHGAPYSLMLKTADLQDDYDLLMFFKNNIIALSGTKGAIVDLAHLPEMLGDNTAERLMKYIAYRKAGVAIFDSSQEGEVINQVFNGFDDTVSYNSLQAIQAAIQMVEETASSITGVFRERLGGIHQRDAVANVEMGMQQSYIITKQYYQAMDTLVREILTDCINMAGKVYKNGFTGQLILGDLKQVFTLKPEHYSMTTYDVHISDSSQIIKEQEQLKMLAQSYLQSNLMDPEILVQITTASSLSEMKKAVLETVRAKKTENDQLAQLQQALQEAQTQQQELQKQLEKSTQQIIKFNEKRLAIEEQNNAMEQEIARYKIDVQRELKERELDLIENRNKIEAMELLDNNPANNEVENKLK